VKDPGTIKFNHFRHLVDLHIDKKLMHLECIDCHRTTKGDQVEWPWADKTLLQPAAMTTTDHRPVRDYMAPIKFEQHCSNSICHPLVYSDQTVEPSPHRIQPELLEGTLKGGSRVHRGTARARRSHARRHRPRSAPPNRHAPAAAQ
jgi:hypothetical protein